MISDIRPYDASEYPDDGRFNKLYPITKENSEQFLVYDNTVQKISHIQANLVAIFEDWLMSYFPDDFFKTRRLTTQSSFADFKSFMKDIYKKEKPIVVIDVSPIQYDESALFANNAMNRFNMIDPRYDDATGKILYSIEVLSIGNIELRFRRNRFSFSFDVLYMTSSMNRQHDLYTYILMNMRISSKFSVYRTVNNLIPLEYIQNIASFAGFKDYRSDEFLEYLNQYSRYPIIKRILPNGMYMFYMSQNISLYFEIPNSVSMDSPEKSAAFEKGARIRQQVTVSADLPSEFIFLTTRENGMKYQKFLDKEPENVYYIMPDLSFPEFEKEISFNDRLFTAITSTKLMIEDDKDGNVVNVLEDIIAAADADIYENIKEYISSGNMVSDIILVVLYRQDYLKKKIQSTRYHPTNDGFIDIPNPNFRELYQLVTYVSFSTLNEFKIKKNKEYIGTIEKY